MVASPAHCLLGLDAMSQCLPRDAGRAGHVLVGAVSAAANESCVQGGRREGEKQSKLTHTGGVVAGRGWKITMIARLIVIWRKPG